MSLLGRDPFSDFDKQFERHQDRMVRTAFFGSIWSLLVSVGFIAAVVGAVLYVHRHW